MSHSKVETSRKRRVFSEEFKQDAVRLVVSENYTFAAAAKAVGVGEQSLRKWHARLAPKPEPCGENASLDELRAENERLRRDRQPWQLAANRHARRNQTFASCCCRPCKFAAASHSGECLSGFRFPKRRP